MKNTFLSLATILALSSCTDGYQKPSSTTAIDDPVAVKLPAGCNNIIDIKFYPNGSAGFDEILCRSSDGSLVLYVKDVEYAQKWTARQYVH